MGDHQSCDSPHYATFYLEYNGGGASDGGEGGGGRRNGRRLNGFLGLSLNDRTILFLVMLLDKTVSVGQDSLWVFASRR